MSAFAPEISATYDNRDDALSAARLLVDLQLAACVHVEGPITSIYRWEGKIAEEAEWHLTAKTRTDLRQAAIEHMEKTHPYELPAILSRDIQTSPAFAAWVANETKT